MQSGANDIGKGQPVSAFGLPRNYLGNRFVYAVISQRAQGLSLGVNLNPARYCNFDCVYCEVNRSDAPAECPVEVPVMEGELRHLLEVSRMRKFHELEGFSRMSPELLELKEVALSGDGEPTLCPNFEEVVQTVLQIRSVRRPFLKVVLITNTAGLTLPYVRRGLDLLTPQDELWVKLEAGTQEYMNKVNRPDLTLGKVMANILEVGRLRPVIIQSLFPLLDNDGPADAEIEEYAKRLRELKARGAQIALVQVYSAHRPAQNPGCGHLPLKTLSAIAQRVRDITGLKTQVF